MEPGAICSLEDVIIQAGFMQEEDALVLFKFMVKAVQELHLKLIKCNRICMNNFVFSQPGVLKLGYNTP